VWGPSALDAACIARQVPRNLLPLIERVAMPVASTPCITLRDGEAAPEALRGAVLVLGNFDGVHLGHRHVTGQALALGQDLQRPVVALTFEPHPRTFFRPAEPVFRLTPPEQKQALLLEAGLGGVITLPFDAKLAGLTAEAFVTDLLVGRLRCAGLVSGHDFHFGKGRGGSPEMLVAWGAEHHLPVRIVSPFQRGDMLVSSSAIRDALRGGDVAGAARLLGRDWSVTGEVRHGDKRGRLLGYPTAIYAVRMIIDGTSRDGVASFGRRPTFDDGAPRLETFLFDFSGDLYGKQVEVSLAGWLRGEEKFDSVEALIVQMRQDEAQARRILASHTKV
jgi:riboflavin kinase / FMN adenylyltransferase